MRYFIFRYVCKTSNHDNHRTNILLNDSNSTYTSCVEASKFLRRNGFGGRVLD